MRINSVGAYASVYHELGQSAEKPLICILPSAVMFLRKHRICNDFRAGGGNVIVAELCRRRYKCLPTDLA